MSQDKRSKLLPPGFLIDDKFEIVSLIGSGGTSDVYKARHRLLDSFVAIKVIHKDLTDSKTAGIRFQREASVLNSLQHENIVRFLSFGQLEDGRYFMAQELLPGLTLDQILAKEKTLEPGRALNLVSQVCRGLRLAHQNNIVHRDIKPANIAVFDTNEGETAKILDFGIYKNTEQSKEQSLTSTGQVLGTYKYASPEQCCNNSVTPASDIYSLGCVFYEMLCGAPPFADESELAILNNQAYTAIENVPSAIPISNQLKKILLKCLKKTPDERYQNAEELDFALRQADLRKPISEYLRLALIFTLILTFAGVVSTYILRQNKIEATAKIPLSLKHPKTSGNNSAPKIDGKSPEDIIAIEDEWLEQQASKWKIEDAIDAWCASANARKQRQIKTLPPETQLIEQKANEKLHRMFKLNSPNEPILNFLEKYVFFLSIAQKNKEAENWLSMVKIEPGHLQDKRKMLSCYIILAKQGAPDLNLENLLLERLALVKHIPFATWDDYQELADCAKKKGDLSKHLEYLKKSVEACFSSRLVEEHHDLRAKRLASSLQLAKANFEAGNKNEARKAIQQFEESVPTTCKTNLRIYNIEADALGNADESDWAPLLKAALKCHCQEYKSAASVLAKHAFYVGKKENYEGSLADLRAAIKIYKTCVSMNSKTQQKVPLQIGESEAKTQTEDKIPWLSRTPTHQVPPGEIMNNLALALIMTGKKDEASKVVAAVINESQYQPPVKLFARDIQICLKHENDPAIMLEEHQKLFEESRTNMSFATNQPSIVEHIIEDFEKLKKMDEARNFLLKNQDRFWLESTKASALQLAKIIEEHPDNWRDVVINNNKSQSLK